MKRKGAIPLCNRDDAIRILGEVYNQCASIIPVSDAYLYGSYARGDHRESSDVDIMVISPLSRDALHDHRWDFAHISSEISMNHDVTVSLTVRAEDQFKPQTIPYHGNVVKDGIRYSAIGTHA